ncbi:hypothetical protein DH2020_044805 [Rehmannia glutinosa]|uniref:PHD-type domain-containing protein n=1 Tax=Rehmannia glutinosa TaxID=99300 RepID=A0ABR0UFY0_REHGL
MAKPKPARRTRFLHGQHISKTIRPGDCVLMRPSDSSKPSYVARVEKIEAIAVARTVPILLRASVRCTASRATLSLMPLGMMTSSVVSSTIRLLVLSIQTELPCRYCKCEMPYNPDDLMVQCEGCSDWFHPTCIDMTPEEAKRVDHFYCHTCSSEDQKRLENSHVSTRIADAKSSFIVLSQVSGLKPLFGVDSSRASHGRT